MVMVSFLLCTTVLWSQDNKDASKIAFNLEYGIGTSGINNGNDLVFPSHNLFARVRYAAGSLVTPTIGLGFLTAGSSFRSKLGAQLYLYDDHNTTNVQYLVIPMGLNVKLTKIDITLEGSFALLVGANTRERSKVYHLDRLPTLVLHRESDVTQDNDAARSISYPLILTTSCAIQISNFEFTLGCKLFYSLNDIADTDSHRIGNYYGASLTIGKEF